MNARNHLPTVARHGLEALLVEGRVPLDAALQLAHALIRALEAHHATGQFVGPFDAASTSVDVIGQVVVKPSLDGETAAPELASGGVPDVLSDLYSLGAVFYRLFAGVSHVEAAKRAGGHLPPPSRFNPTIDDTLDALILTLLDADPMERPYRLAQVDGQLLAICSDIGLEPSTEAISAWVAAHRPAAAPVIAAPPPIQLVTVAAPVAVPAAAPRHAAPVAPRIAPPRQSPPRVQWTLEQDDDEAEHDSREEAWEGPIRFDLWAAASAGVVFIGVTLIALM